MSAAAKGDMKLVERLIKAGADILVADQVSPFVNCQITKLKLAFYVN